MRKADTYGEGETMKHGLISVSLLMLSLTLAACGGGKSSAVEGKLVDWNGKPVAGVKITAAQVQPLKGYEQFEAVTGSDGSFRIRGLFPSSQYVLKPWSDKWTCETSVTVESAPQGETAMVPSPMVIQQVYTISEPRLIADIATGVPATTTVEGKLLDWRGKPVARVKVVATQEQPIRRYEQFETETAADGSFQIAGLLPASRYQVRPWSDKWTCEVVIRLDSAAHHGERVLLRSPMVIAQAYSRSSGSLVADLATGDIAITVVEGSLIDGNDSPVPRVKMSAYPVNAGGASLESLETTITGEDGEFRFSKLPAAQVYVIRPWSDHWTTFTYASVKSAQHHGEKVVLPPLKMRYTVSKDSVIFDSQTGLEWVAGPDRDTDYAQAEQWVAGCKVAGGGWRMPTRQELATQYQEGVGERNRDPAFKTTGWYFWAEPRDSSSAWYFNFGYGGGEYWGDRSHSSTLRVFAVRSRSR